MWYRHVCIYLANVMSVYLTVGTLSYFSGAKFTPCTYEYTAVFMSLCIRSVSIGVTPGI